MVERDNPNLSIGMQCKLLSISRSSYYDQSKGKTGLNLMLMRQTDTHPSDLDTPFIGVRQMTWHLRNDGHPLTCRALRSNVPRGWLMKSGSEARTGIAKWVAFYNHKRAHSAGQRKKKSNPVSRSREKFKLRWKLSKHWGVAHDGGSKCLNPGEMNS